MTSFLSPAYDLGARKIQSDAAIEPVPNPSGHLSIVLEVGCSESLTQLRNDASLWLEHTLEVS